MINGRSVEAFRRVYSLVASSTYW